MLNGKRRSQLVRSRWGRREEGTEAKEPYLSFLGKGADSARHTHALLGTKNSRQAQLEAGWARNLYFPRAGGGAGVGWVYLGQGSEQL